MTIHNQIEAKLIKEFNPIHLEVINESHQHSVPKGSESHFKVIVVSDLFKNKKLVEQHRLVNQVLKEELNGIIHALALHTFSPEDWTKKNKQAKDSPACLGGSKSH